MTKEGSKANKREKKLVRKPIPSVVYPKLMTCCLCKAMARMNSDLNQLKRSLINQEILHALKKSKKRIEGRSTTSDDSSPHCLAESTEEGCKSEEEPGSSKDSK